MVYSESYSRFFHLLAVQCNMEIAVLLLLTVAVTAASPLRLTHGSDTGTAHLKGAVQIPGVKKSKGAEEGRAPAESIHSESKHLNLDALKHSMTVKLRPQRAPQRGCQLGTCQFHNLANTLFNFSKTSGKDESKKANDPQGYGR